MSDHDGGLLGRHLQPLLDQREATWDDMVSTIQHDVPSYRKFATPDEEAEWAAGVLQLFDMFLELAVEQPRWLTEKEAQSIRRTGATRFDQGFSIADVRASVRLAIGVARTRIMQEYEPTGPADRAAGDRVLALLDRFGNEVEDLLQEGYEARRDELTTGNQAASRFFDHLAGGVPTEGEFSRGMDRLGLDATAAYCSVLLPDSPAGVAVAAELGRLLPTTVVLHRSSAVTPHHLAVVPASGFKTCSEVSEAGRVAAGDFATTALATDSWRGPTECHDRYAAAVVLVPHLACLAEGRTLLKAAELTLHSVVASLPPPARQRLCRAVLRGVDANPELLEFLRVSIKIGFVLNAVKRQMDRDIKTVRRWRTQLELATERKYLDKTDQFLLMLGYFAVCMGD